MRFFAANAAKSSSSFGTQLMQLTLAPQLQQATLHTEAFRLPCGEQAFIAWALSQPFPAWLESSDGSGPSSLRFGPARRFAIEQSAPRPDPTKLKDVYTLPPVLRDLREEMARAPALKAAATSDDAAQHSGLHGPGWVVMASYELGGWIEPSLPDPQVRGGSFPLLSACFYRWSLRRDKADEWTLIWLEYGDGWSLDALKQQLMQAGVQPGQPTQANASPRGASSTLTRNQYGAAFTRTINAIRDGECYIANLTQAYHYAAAKKLTRAEVPALARSLSQLSPAPYAAVFEAAPEHWLISSSPECFLRVSGQEIETQPIKGTRRVASDPARDAALQAELRASEKERAELTMIVDLERNDLGRVCEAGSVRVPVIHELRTYAHVHHMIGIVQGELREEIDFAALLHATFPGGSITGAPKVATMKLLRELEPRRRGPYTGSLFALGMDGSLESSILIRTILAEPSGISFNTGGGIVFDSIERDEFRECLHKARGIRKALKRWDQRD